MTPAIAALLGGGVTAGYVPILRSQIRNGVIGIPFGTINPIQVRRDDHPLVFRAVIVGFALFMLTLLIVCALIVARSVTR